jgi:hypothetical protein
MSDGFGKLAPGFDFLQSLAKNAGNAMPGLGQWIAPTLDPAELDKRIGELRTVQYWLEQNARLLATTIQALEVQRMTLKTLHSMNVPMGDLTESLKIQPSRASAPAASPRSDGAKKQGGERAAKSASAVDPMQWWGALTQQFAQLATSAMQDSAADAATALAGGIAKQAAAATGDPAARSAGAKRAGPAAKRARTKAAPAAKA